MTDTIDREDVLVNSIADSLNSGGGLKVAHFLDDENPADISD